jgi:hypothetical protein
MLMGEWTAPLASERMADHRQAELQRLAQARHRGSRMRLTLSMAWPAGPGPGVRRLAAAPAMARLTAPGAGRPAGVSGTGWPARSETRVEGVWDGRWSEWFGGLQLDSEGTRPSCRRAAGVLGPARRPEQGVRLGLSVIAVRRVPPMELRDPMKRIRIERPKRRRERPWLEVLPVDPRDPEVVRARPLGRSTARMRKGP